MLFTQNDTPTKEIVESALKEVVVPGKEKDVVSLSLIKRIQIQDRKLRIELIIPEAGHTDKERLSELCRKRLESLPGVEFVHVVALEPRSSNAKDGASGPDIRKASPDANRIKIPGVQHIVAVASGKGGVGKSTVAVNLAAALVKQGKRVGLLDADIHGPSLPMMLGVAEKKPGETNGKLTPITQYDIRTMSMGFLVPPGEPVVWRGPMIHKILTQFLTRVEWGELDYLIIDMAPGTGDTHLTLIQAVELAGAIIVTTPQEISRIDAQKGLRMFESVQVPVLGVIENMSGFVSPDTGKVHELFKRGGGSRLAQEANTALLGTIPLDPRVMEGADSGEPILMTNPEGEVATAFIKIAAQLSSQLNTQ